MIYWVFLLLAEAQQPDPRQDLIDAGREERSILSQIETLDIALSDLRKEKEGILKETQTFETQKLEKAANVAQATLELQSKKTELNKIRK